MSFHCGRCNSEIEGGRWPFCRGLASEHGELHPSSAKTAAFPFESKHITPNGEPLTIESMQHLRRVEKEYGVVLSAFSKSNDHDTDPIHDVPRYRGKDEDFIRDHRR